MGRPEFIFHSPLAPAEAMEALRSAVDEERWGFSLSGYRGDLPVLGKFSEEKFRLRKRIYYNNGFARLFYGRPIPESGGTRVEGHFAMNSLTRVFMSFWFGIVGLVCVSTLFTRGAEFVTGRFLREEGWLGLIPFGMLAGGFLLVFVGRLLSRGGERFIVEYVQDALNARVEEP